jgi:hypothetical protein
MSLLRRKSLKPPRRLTGPNEPSALASGSREIKLVGSQMHPAPPPASPSGEPAALRVTDDGPGVDSRVICSRVRRVYSLNSYLCPRRWRRAAFELQQLLHVRQELNGVFLVATLHEKLEDGSDARVSGPNRFPGAGWPAISGKP